ncbi:hypothetical protein HWV62_6179 [Athelia sp. TMB]|nr:hypothetical protein HWV62_6179 [Athelia sp. TMB]
MSAPAPAAAPAAPHLQPHVENLGTTITDFHAHVHKDEHHEHPQVGVLKGINNAALHFLQLAANAKKDFPDALKHHFYHGLHKEVKSAEKAAKKFIEQKPSLVEKGVNGKEVTLALEGQLIAVIALFDVLKAQDKEFQKHAGHIEQELTATIQGAIDAYSK